MENREPVNVPKAVVPVRFLICRPCSCRQALPGPGSA